MTASTLNLQLYVWLYTQYTGLGLKEARAKAQGTQQSLKARCIKEARSSSSHLHPGADISRNAGLQGYLEQAGPKSPRKPRSKQEDTLWSGSPGNSPSLQIPGA